MTSLDLLLAVVAVGFAAWFGWRSWSNARSESQVASVRGHGKAMDALADMASAHAPRGRHARPVPKGRGRGHREQPRAQAEPHERPSVVTLQRRPRAGEATGGGPPDVVAPPLPAADRVVERPAPARAQAQPMPVRLPKPPSELVFVSEEMDHTDLDQPHPPERANSGWLKKAGMAAVAVGGVAVLGGAVVYETAGSPSATRPGASVGGHGHKGTTHGKVRHAHKRTPGPQTLYLHAVSTTPTGAVYDVPATTFTVHLMANGPCWVQERAGANGPVVYQGMMGPGNVYRVMVAHAPGAWVRLGAASSVWVVADGHRVVIPQGAVFPYDLSFLAKGSWISPPASG